MEYTLWMPEPDEPSYCMRGAWALDDVSFERRQDLPLSVEVAWVCVKCGERVVTDGTLYRMEAVGRAMDIQRGDQVYYRGEVWDVSEVRQLTERTSEVCIIRGTLPDWVEMKWVVSQVLQRVEQVR